MKLVIPTRLREELPEGFIYPLWPTRVSERLEGTPHREDSELVFRWRDELRESKWRERIENRGTVKLIEAVYTPHWSPYFPKWKINIFSVPEYYLVAAQKLLFEGGGMEDFVQRLKNHGLTPEGLITEAVTMDLSEWRYDGKRRTTYTSNEKQKASDPNKAA